MSSEFSFYQVTSLTSEKYINRFVDLSSDFLAHDAHPGEGRLGLAQVLSAVAVAWQLAVKQEQSVWPRACSSDTCPDNTLRRKAARAVLPAARHDHGTRCGAWQREAMEEFLLQQRFYNIVLG